MRLVDPSDLQGCDFEWRYTEEGEKVRVSARTGRIIPIPESNNHTHDYKTKGAYVEREKDTPGMLRRFRNRIILINRLIKLLATTALITQDFLQMFPVAYLGL